MHWFIYHSLFWQYADMELSQHTDLAVSMWLCLCEGLGNIILCACTSQKKSQCTWEDSISCKCYSEIFHSRLKFLFLLYFLFEWLEVKSDFSTIPGWTEFWNNTTFLLSHSLFSLGWFTLTASPTAVTFGQDAILLQATHPKCLVVIKPEKMDLKLLRNVLLLIIVITVS